MFTKKNLFFQVFCNFVRKLHVVFNFGYGFLSKSLFATVRTIGIHKGSWEKKNLMRICYQNLTFPFIVLYYWFGELEKKNSQHFVRMGVTMIEIFSCRQGVFVIIFFNPLPQCFAFFNLSRAFNSQHKQRCCRCHVLCTFFCFFFVFLIHELAHKI